MVPVAERAESALWRGPRFHWVLAIIVAALLAGCAMGDIFNGPLPVDVTDSQIIGTWVGQNDTGRFVFASDKTLTASDLPADALPPLPASHRWSCTGTWEITYPIGGDPKQRNIVEIGLFNLPGVEGGYAGRLSASMPDKVIVLSMGNYTYIKQ